MQEHRASQISDLYHRALGHPPTEREAFLREACGDDAALREEVESLLQCEEPSSRFLETPAAAIFETEVDESAQQLVGHSLGHYTVKECIGIGGMGEVYRAHDGSLERDVAIKILPSHFMADLERRARFTREARVLATLNHPNIVTIYGIDSADGLDFIAMEYVVGTSLDRVIPGGGLPVEKAIDYSTQIARAIAAGHVAGVVHRDIKPANVLVTANGLVKVLDFGLARFDPPLIEAKACSRPALRQTAASVVFLGTPGYASPEQVASQPGDARSDVFMVGAVLYEMLAGRRAFKGDSRTSVFDAVQQATPAPFKATRRDVPMAVERIVARCLEKEPDKRYHSAIELLNDLEACQAQLAARRVRLRAVLRRPRVAGAALFAVTAMVAILIVGYRQFARQSSVTWAYRTALPQIERLNESQEFDAAFRLVREVERIIPDDREFQHLKARVSRSPAIETVPSDADVFVKGYSAVEADWIPVGRTPIKHALMPAGFLRVLITKSGFDNFEGAFTTNDVGFQFRLTERSEAPPGMVLIPAGPSAFGGNALKDYWLDRYEVTNREFKEFVDAGAYERPELWTHAFVKDGRKISWQQAMAMFRDTTGRPGPGSWEAGRYPDSQGDHPVTGVSWYEAAAYADFAGKSLPTVYHWSRASGVGDPFIDQIARLSNFSRHGPARGGQYSGLSTFGVYDMAGNVREWSLNETETGFRYLMGGAWDDPIYIYFEHPDASTPFDRSVKNGFRCAKYQQPLPDALLATVKLRIRDYSKERPAEEELFEVYRSLYAYDRKALNARVESTAADLRYWLDETITLDAAYGGERMNAHLLLPLNALPPYQTVLFYPGDSAFRFPWDHPFTTQYVEFLLRNGRAVMYPFFKGMHDGSGMPQLKRLEYRDRVIEWYKDLARSVDYLETRADIDTNKLAFYGFSRGAMLGPIFVALEPRFKVSVLLSGGFAGDTPPPETYVLNFVPRVKVPTLMLHGRYDGIRPLETHGRPLFQLLGAPEARKRLAVTESGHIVPMNVVIPETLNWLDRYLGPVRRR